MAREKERRTPHHSRLLTQRALLAHGVLVLERVVRELRRVVRGRVTVAGRPVEGDCAVSCERGGEKHSVRAETGSAVLNQNRGRGAPAPQPRTRNPSGGLCHPTGLQNLRRGARPKPKRVTSQPAPRLFFKKKNTKPLTSPPFPNSFTPLHSSTLPAASEPNLGQVEYETANCSPEKVLQKQTPRLLLRGSAGERNESVRLTPR